MRSYFILVLSLLVGHVALAQSPPTHSHRIIINDGTGGTSAANQAAIPLVPSATAVIVCPNTVYKVEALYSSIYYTIKATISGTVFYSTSGAAGPFAVVPDITATPQFTGDIYVYFLPSSLGTPSIDIKDNSNVSTSSSSFSVQALNRPVIHIDNTPITASSINACLDPSTPVTRRLDAVCPSCNPNATFEWKIYEDDLTTIRQPIPYTPNYQPLSLSQTYFLPDNQLGQMSGDAQYAVVFSKVNYNLISYTHGPTFSNFVCIDSTALELVTRLVPDLGAPTVAIDYPNGAQVCSNGENNIRGNCINNCPTPPSMSAATGSYQWLFRTHGETGNFGTTASSDYVYSVTSDASNSTGINYNVHPVNLSLLPGRYDVFLRATNESGCSTTVKLDSSYVVNAVPAVILYHNEGDPSNWTTTTPNSNNRATNHSMADPSILCTGRELELRVKGCADNDYDPTLYSSTGYTNPTTPNDPTNGQNGTYNSPCSGDYFDILTFRVEDQAVTGGGRWLQLNGSGSTFEIGNTNPPPASPTNRAHITGHSAVKNTMILSSLHPGEKTIQVTAIGHNGCTATDMITVSVKEPKITYEASSRLAPYPDNSFIPGCEGYPLKVKARCDLCYPDSFPADVYQTRWTNPAGTGPDTINAGIANGTSNQPVTSVDVTAPIDTTRYNLTLIGKYGCTNSNNTVPSGFDLRSRNSVDVAYVTYPQKICSGSRMDLTVHNPSGANYNYAIYEEDPRLNPSAVPICGPNINPCHDNNSGGNRIIYSPGYVPIADTAYYVAVYPTPSSSEECPQIFAVAANGTSTVDVRTPITITETPDVSVGNIYPSSSGDLCNNAFSYLFIRRNSFSSNITNWRTTWTGTAANNGNGIPNDNIDEPFDPGHLNPLGTQGLMLQIQPSQMTYTPIANGGGVNFTAVINNNGCSTVVNFPTLNMTDCDNFTLVAKFLNENGDEINANAATDVAVNDRYNAVCEGKGIKFKVFPITAGATYRWQNGSTLSEYTYRTSRFSPDTVTVAVTVTVAGNDQVITHGFRVSRLNANIFPAGDTSICEGDKLNLAVNCPTCYGDVLYRWRTSTSEDIRIPYYRYPYYLYGNGFYNGSAYQYNTLSIPAAPPDFTLTLTIRHGPNYQERLPNGGIYNHYCEDVSVRRIRVSRPPDVQLTYQQTPTSPIDTLSTANNSTLVHMCVGQPGELSVSCRNCFGSGALTDYAWNTGATSPKLSVNSPGGYYVETTNGNNCKATTSIGVLVYASDGYNSTAVANPSQICSGRDAILEVPPCVGCSYEWFEQSTSVGGNRTHATNTPATYFAEVRNAEGCVYPSSAVVIGSSNFSPPQISSTTDSICDGQSATLSTPTVAGASYQWLKMVQGRFSPISGATDTSYTTAPNDTGLYIVTVTYPNGCLEESPIFQLYKGDFAPNIYTPYGQEICGASTLELSTDLNAGWQYQWYRNGIPLVGETGSSHYADSAGSYYVLVTNNNLCQEITQTVSVTKSTLSKPNASTSTPTICPGELGRLSVSLCSNCDYQWFNTNPTALTTQSTSNFNYNNVQTTGNYYAVVSRGNCFEVSDTVTIVQNQVFTPSINAVSNVVCDGLDATLITQGCAGCSYTWLLDGSPALGALNDTFHIVSSVNNVGNYSVVVDYPNGCFDTSTTLLVVDGSYDVTMTLDTPAPLPALQPDYVICNGIGEDLKVIASSIQTGTYVYTLFLNNTPVTGASNINVNNFINNFYVDAPGVYTAQVIDPRGCVENTDTVLTMRSIDVVPQLYARATSDPSSVPANAICSADGTVYLWAEVPTCSGDCNFDWTRDALSLTTQPISGDSAHITAAGSMGAGLYAVTVIKDGCAESSAPVFISDALGSLVANVNRTSASICANNSVLLSYTGTCGNCSYRWLGDSLPINGASVPQYTATSERIYNLELTDNITGCIDTSVAINVIEVTPPISFNLDLASTATPATPLASNSSPIDLNNWLTPTTIQRAALTLPDSGQFISTPFSANINCGGAIPCYPGLSGPGNQIFTPADSLAGFFQITYLYTTNGCTFSTSDILEVLEPAAITISNANPASVPYEACIGDVLTIQTTNTDSAVGSLWAYDVNGNYVQMTPDLIINRDTIFGANTFWNTTIVWTVPDSAYASNLMLRYTNGQDSVLTPFLLIHNTDLTLSGLPSTGELCSNGEGLTLFGNPSGGTLSVETPSGVPMPGVTVADTLYPSFINPTLYNNGEQSVNVIYNYTETYTNGNTCPNPNQVAIQMDVLDVRLTGIDYNTIAVSQVREKLTNLVYRTYPYEARANKQPWYTSTFSGSFTSPAGAPEFFLPANAGIGRHALTYSIQNGTCINSVEDSITVVAAPAGLGIPDTICRDFGVTAFGRSTSFPFNFSTPPPPNSTIAFMDSVHVLRVSGRGVTAVNTNLGAETFTYDPTAVGGSLDTLVMEYIFYRNEDTLATGQPFDTLEYVVASIVQPIFIEDPLTVQITDTIVSPFYCQENTLKLLAASPPDTFGRGLFMLFGGTNQYQNGDTLFNSVINPFDVNNLENATTTYDLVYILNGAACRNADTMQITIARGLNPAFTTVTGQTAFCDDDPAVGIVHSVMPPDTAIWKIGGIPQPGYTFSPAALNPALHVVELQQIYTYTTPTDTFFCSASAIDTFEIYPLPAVSISPALDAHYCANDTMVDFVVSPSPDCPVFGANGHYLLEENFDAGIPASWVVTTNAGSPWAPDAILPLGGVGGAAITDTSTAVNDAWLVSEPMNLVAGHTYRLSYMVRAGAADPTCSGFCDASLRVAIGTAATPTAITAQLDYQPIINNDQAYVRYTVDHFHDPGAGFVTGTYYMGFHSFTPAFGRSLRLDDVEFRDLTVDSCVQAGIGVVAGPGAFKVVDSLYRFDPLAVPAGNITVAYAYTDIRGCSNTTSYNITVDTAPVVSFTNMDSSYCENEPTVMLTGSPLGGNFNSTLGHGVNLINIPFSAPLDTAFYPVNYQTNVTGTDIVSYAYLDGNGCSETAYDTVVIVPLVDVNVISQSLDPLGYGHCVNATHTPLFVDAASGALFTNGVFYGPGVRNGAGGANDPANGAKFYPDSAALDLGHTGDANLMYVYNTSTGCSDTARFTTRVHALPDPYFANLPDSLCINADTFQVVAINRVVTGPLGQTTFLDTIAANGGFYTVTDVNGTASSNFIVLFDTLNPGAAGNSPWMNVEYLYRAPNSRGGCEATIYDSVRIDSVPVVYFDGLRDYYCENEPPSIFLAFPSYYVGSGYLQIGNLVLDSSFYWIDPAMMVGPGQTVATYPTYYTYMDSRGCVGEVLDTFQVRPYPRITFTPNYQDTFCRQVGLYDLRQALNAPIGGYFTDNLPLTSIVDSFYLNLNSSPGPRLVTYHYTDPLTQCSNKDSMWIYIFSSPELDFQAFGGCAQMDITFQGTASNLIPGVDSITGIWWDFEGNGNLTYTRLDTTPITIPDTMYQYATDGVYNVTLYVNNQGGCVESITKPLIISPYYNLATGDYFEDFNAGAGDWHSDQPTVVTPDSVWTHEFSITGNHINHNDGAWVVMKDGIYQENQQAWVYSPCYDFTTARRPMIAFDLWRDVLASIDGVVLEFYNNSTRQWERIGDIGQGIQWYQDFVLARPGNQPLSVTNFPIGWTGRSGQFESARLRLDQFKGQRDVRFRIAFASAASSVIDTSWTGYEGAAFDNVWVGERTRNVLVEHFSNENYTDAASQTSKTIDQAVYNKIFNSNYGLDVILLQYQVDKNGHTGDPIFRTNTGDLNARSLTYGAGPNDVLIDGRSVGSGRSTDLRELEMDIDMLQFPAFDIRIDQPLMVVQGQVTAIATVEALQVMPNRRYTIRMAAIQDSLTFTSNTTPTVYHEMLSVVRKLMPNNSGTPEYHAWSIGQTATAREDWNFSLTPSFNSNQLEVVVFIQDDSTKEVYQAASTQDVNRFNGTQQIYDQDQRTEIFDVNVFPNPTSELFNVAFKAPLSQAYNWRLIDVTGRTLQQGMAQAGIQQFGISADRLTDGAYFFIIHSEDNEVYAQRKLIVIKR